VLPQDSLAGFWGGKMWQGRKESTGGKGLREGEEGKEEVEIRKESFAPLRPLNPDKTSENECCDTVAQKSRY